MPKLDSNKQSIRTNLCLSDLITEVAMELNTDEELVKNITKTFLTKLSTHLSKSNTKISLYEFGRFETTNRISYSPMSNEHYNSISVRFKISKKVRKKMINNKINERK